MKQLKWLILGSFLFFAGCKSSYIISSWGSQKNEGKNYDTILVLGLMHDKDQQLQEKIENHIAGNLNNLGYNAFTSIEKYGPNAFCEMTEKQALGKLKNSGIDAIMTIVLANKKIEKQFIPDTWPGNPNQHFQPGFWDYYRAVRKQIFEPGYYFENTQYFWETNLYEMAGQLLLYSVQSQSFNPDNKEKLAHEYAQVIIKNMSRKKVIRQQPARVQKGF